MLPSSSSSSSLLSVLSTPTTSTATATSVIKESKSRCCKVATTVDQLVSGGYVTEKWPNSKMRKKIKIMINCNNDTSAGISGGAGITGGAGISGSGGATSGYAGSGSDSGSYNTNKSVTHIANSCNNSKSGSCKRKRHQSSSHLSLFNINNRSSSNNSSNNSKNNDTDISMTTKKKRF